MIAIAITAEAYEAIKATLLGTSEAPPHPGPDGQIRIWLDGKFVERLGRMRELVERLTVAMGARSLSQAVRGAVRNEAARWGVTND